MSIYLHNEQKQQLEGIYPLSNDGKLLKFIQEILNYFESSTELKKLLEQIRNREIFNDINEHSKALVKLLIESKQLRLSEKEIYTQFKILTKFSEDQINILSNFINESTLDELITSEEYHFRDLEWRVETKIASRFCDSLPIQPKIAIKLHVDKDPALEYRESLPEPLKSQTRKEILLQTNINNLTHIIGKLEAAKNSVSIKRTK